MKRPILLILAAAMLLSLFTFVSCDEQDVNGFFDAVLAIVDALPEDESGENDNSKDPDKSVIVTGIDENGTFDDKDSVALYIVTYGKLPKNYITKAEAEALGWEGGSVEKYAKGKCIGGSRFGNHEGILPKKSGRQYYECDIDTLGKDSRGAKRIVYSNDGLVYYTDDHYESFELLYGEE